jgi:hypothetical protein
MVQIPVELIAAGNNSIKIGAGLADINSTGGSPDDKVIYTLKIGGITMEGYSSVFPKAQGSTITVYYDYDGDNIYDGTQTLEIGPNPQDIFDPENDSIDDAILRLLDNLNFISDANPGSYGAGTAGNPYDGINSTNPIDLQLVSDIEINSGYISGVPTLWNPVKLEINIWI